MGFNEFLTRVPIPKGSVNLIPQTHEVGALAGGAGTLVTLPEVAAALVVSGATLLLGPTDRLVDDKTLLRDLKLHKDFEKARQKLDEKREVQNEYTKLMERILNHPAEPERELQKAEYSSNVGQGDGVLYLIKGEITRSDWPSPPYAPNSSPYIQQFEFFAWGPISKIRSGIGEAPPGSIYGGVALFVQCRGIYRYPEEPSQYHRDVQLKASEFTVGFGEEDVRYPPKITHKVTSISRADGKPDTTSPLPTTPPLTSKPGQNFAPGTAEGASGAGAVVGIGGTAIARGLGATASPPSSMPDQSREIVRGGGVRGVDDTSATQTPTVPLTNTDTNPTVGTALDVPAVLVGPASNNGSITTTKAFDIPSGGQTVTWDKTTGEPIIEAKPQSQAPATTASPHIPDIEQIKKDFQKLLDPNTGLAPTVIGTVLAAPIITTIASNTTRNAIATAAEYGTCNSFKPNGCNAGIAQNIGDIAGNAANNNTLLRNLSDILGAGNQALIPAIWNDVRTLNTKVGDVTGIGSVGKFLSGLSDWSGISRIMDAITMVATVHNALMLSNNVEHTLFQIIDNVVSIPTLIVNPKAEQVNSEKVVGDLVSSFFKNILGTQGWTALQAEWKALNTINSTAANVYGNVQSIVGDTQTIQNITNEWVAQLGNALQNEGLIGEDNWTPKPDKPHFRSKALGKLEGMADGIQKVDTALQTINTVTQALLDVVQQGNQIKENLGELNKAKDEAVEAAKKLYEAEVDKIKLPDFDIDDLF